MSDDWTIFEPKPRYASPGPDTPSTELSMQAAINSLLMDSIDPVKDIAHFIVNREKALNKIIGVLIHFDFVPPHTGAEIHYVTFKESLLATIDPKIIMTHSSPLITIEARRVGRPTPR